MDVWQDTTLCDSNVSQQLVQFLIVSDGKLEMTGDDTGLLVIASSVTSQLKNFGRKVFENGSEVNWGTYSQDALESEKARLWSKLTSTNTLSVVSLSEKTVNTSYWECETGLG
jgi:hypothetical protein